MMMKYIGNGWWLKGVPARDLTQAEVEARGLDPDVLVESGVYERTGDGRPKTGMEKTEDRGPGTEETEKTEYRGPGTEEVPQDDQLEVEEDVSEEDEIAE